MHNALCQEIIASRHGDRVKKTKSIHRYGKDELQNAGKEEGGIGHKDQRIITEIIILHKVTY